MADIATYTIYHIIKLSVFVNNWANRFRKIYNIMKTKFKYYVIGDLAEIFNNVGQKHVTISCGIRNNAAKSRLFPDLP